MKLTFASKKLKKLCETEKQQQKDLQPKMAQRLRQRLMELQAADTLAEISHLPPARLHELTNRKDVFSVDLQHPMRLLLTPAHEPIPLKEDGGVDKSQVTEIKIMKLEDTHDKKNQRRG